MTGPSCWHIPWTSWRRGMFVHIKTHRSGLSRTHRKPALQTWSNEWFLSQPGNKTSCAILWFWMVATSETSSRNKWPNVCERLPRTTITTYHSLMTRQTLTHGYFSCCSDLRIGSWTEIRSECVGQRVRVSSVSELRKTTDAAWFQAGCARALVKSSRTIEIQHVCMMSLQLHIIYSNYMYTHVCVCVCDGVSMYIYIYMYIYTYIYTLYILLYTYSIMHVYACVFV